MNRNNSYGDTSQLSPITDYKSCCDDGILRNFLALHQNIDIDASGITYNGNHYPKNDLVVEKVSDTCTLISDVKDELHLSMKGDSESIRKSLQHFKVWGYSLITFVKN